MKTSFTEPQKEALLDLLVLGMYVDKHLATAEDERIQKLLNTFQFPTDYTRKQYADASFTRVSRHAESQGDTRTFLTSLAGVFGTPELRREAFALLGSLLASDGKFTPEENKFLTNVQDIFKI